MKSYKILLMLIAIGFGAVSCEDYTDGINVDPNNFTSAPGNLIVGQAQLTAVKLSSSNASRLAGIWTDQFTGADRQYINYNDYSMTAGDFDDEWDDLYADGATQARLAKAQGLQAGDNLLAGVATIMEAMLMGEAAALWGDVPYRNAFDYTENPDPTYDPQEQVFADVQALLDEAITLVGDAKVASVYGTPIFVGNNADWGEIAHTLKARYYMITKEYASAYAESLLGISSPSGSLLSSHSSASGSRNLYYQFLFEQRGGYLTGDNSTLVQLMTGAKDRLLDTPGDANRYPIYFKDLGTGAPDLNFDTDGYFAIDASYPIVSWIENKLIEAESAERTGGADGKVPFNEVRAHLATVYGGAFPATNSAGNQLILEILEEKFVSLPGSLQVWHDARRTNNALGVPIKNATAPRIPQRFFYPQVEINSNDNFPGIVDLFEPTPVNQ
jgi:hypothetical protein